MNKGASVIKAIGPYSLFVKPTKKNPIHFSGLVGIIPETGALVEGGLEAEVKQIFFNMDIVLGEAGVQKTDIAKTTVFLAAMSDFARFNEMYAAYFGDHKPARSCVAVKELPKGAVAEIEILAYE